jgi:hypothetical protein
LRSTIALLFQVSITTFASEDLVYNGDLVHSASIQVSRKQVVKDNWNFDGNLYPYLSQRRSTNT